MNKIEELCIFLYFFVVACLVLMERAREITRMYFILRSGS